MPRISDLDINSVAYWDGIYGGRLFPTEVRNNVVRYRAAAALQLGATALDIGCGQGGVGKALGELRPGVAYVGVDHSQAAIASTVYPQGQYRCCDWRELSEPADTVYVLELIEHVDDPAALLAKAASLARRRLVVGTPRYGLIPYHLHRGEHMWDFTAEELTALLAPYGKVGEIVPTGVECCVVAVDIPNTQAVA